LTADNNIISDPEPVPGKKAEKKRKKNRRGSVRIGIKWKLSVYLAAFTFIIIALLWLFQVVLLDTIYKTVKTGEIKAAAVDLTRALNDSESTLDTVAESVAERNEVCIMVFQMDGNDTATRIVNVQRFDDSMIQSIPRYEIFSLYDTAVSHGGKYLERFRYDELTRVFYSVGDGNFSPSSDEESIVYSVITKNSSGDNLLILLNSVVSPVTAAVKTLNIMLYAIGGVLLVLAVGLAFVMARKISNPIEKINSAAKKLADGDYNADFTGRGYREIEELGDTLNYAAGELSKVDRLRRELIANISHDLRTPLTMIAGYSEVMRDLPGELTPENAQIIIDESKRLSSLVSDVLDISKLESGTQIAEIGEFNLTQTLSQTLERYNRLREHEGYSIDFVADREISVNSDKTRFVQAFCNLVNNALTYTGADKRVVVDQSLRVDLSDGKRYVRISVTDSGDGIPADKLDLIWDRYYKVNSPHKRAAVGTGLGLSIVKNIMQLLGGSCGVKSVVGQGSTFWLELPLT
jgi:Signal transduction histidine kinase